MQSDKRAGLNPQLIASDRKQVVAMALAEDIQTGDLTAQLIEPDTQATATVITREPITLCGQAWFDEVFKQLPSPHPVAIEWLFKDGDAIEANTPLVELSGPAQTLLTGERTALNFLQTLSGTATLCRRYAQIVASTQVKLLDTRKTIPTLRTAQKYAVRCGGCYNHRIGLYDAFLIKENHIFASGSIFDAVKRAKSINPDVLIEVEVETIAQLQEAIAAKTDVIMLDNFSLEQINEAVALAAGSVKLEISGNVEKHNLLAYAETGVDYISIGGLTKHLYAIDLSMRFQE